MSSIAVRRANKRVCPLQPNGLLSRGTSGILAQMGLGGYLGTKGSKGSTSSSETPYPVETQSDRTATLQEAKGSTGNRDAPPPVHCPSCARPTTWLIRGTQYVCYKCQTPIVRAGGDAP